MKNFLSNLKLPFNKGESQIIEDLRRNNLNMSLPRLGAKTKQFELNSKKIEARLSDYSLEKSQQIAEALKYLGRLNKIDVKSQVRYDLTNTIMETVGQSITYIYRHYVSKGSSFPETTERKNALTSLIGLLQNLILSYKLTLASDYSLPIKKFNHKLDRVAFISLKIIELTLWLQRILSIRFQKLSSQNWQDLNVIFSVYANHFNINEEKMLTEQMAFYQASGIASAKNNRRSVASIYISIQVFGMLDISSWPSYSLLSLEKYLERYEGLISLSFEDLHETMNDEIVTYSDHHDVPLFDKNESGVLPCYIKMDKIKRQIQKDIEILEKINFIGKADKKRLAAAGKVKNLEENDGLMQLFLKNLSKGERKEERKALYGAKIIYLYSGIAAIYRLLYEQKKHTQEDENTEGYFQDAAARHSSLLFDSQYDVVEYQWRVVNENSGGYLIRTAETKYMHSMEVGQLIAITYDGKDDLPQLGFITRLDRVHENEVDVAVVKMTNFAESVTAFDPGDSNKAHELLPGILTKNLSDSWRLILPKQVKYVAGTPIMIKRRDVQLPVRLGNIELSRRGFVLFEVRSPGLR